MNTLRELYETHANCISQFAQSFGSEGLDGPLLIEPVAYFRQPTKLLVVGQETAGWPDDYDDIEAQLAAYRDFNLAANYNSPFWNITRKVELILGIERCSCAWTNLNRFAQNGKPPVGAVLAAMPSLDFLVRDEIQILHPDVCLLFTNRKYDDRLIALYPGVQFSDISDLPSSHFARLEHSNLPRLTIRTPHPKTMRLMGWEEPFLVILSGLLAN